MNCPLVYRKCRPLWSYEDITSKVHNIKSAEQMDHFLKFMLRIFKDCQPMAHVEQRWAQEALHLALSCSSRHYAGRSFQVNLYFFCRMLTLHPLRYLFKIFTHLKLCITTTFHNFKCGQIPHICFI